MYVQKIHRCYEDGSTLPVRCCLSDGAEVVVKYRNNPESSKTLVNELIANSLAKLVDNQSLSFGICSLSMEAHLESEVDLQLFTLTPEYCGPAFYVEFVKNIVQFSPSACRRYNHLQLVKMMLFDHIVYNKDRYPRNLLAAMDGSDNIYPIDYSHVFKNECIWDQYTFKQGMAENDFSDRYILESNVDVYKAIFLSSCPCTDDFNQLLKDIPKQLTDAAIQSIMTMLPPEWLEDARISAQDLLTLKEYLLYRVSHLAELVDLIVKEGGKNR